MVRSLQAVRPITGSGGKIYGPGMSVLRWLFVGICAAWGLYLATVATLEVNGVEITRSPLRSTLVIIAAIGSILLGMAVIAEALHRRLREVLQAWGSPAGRLPGDGELSAAYMSDAAELFELGRAAERAGREHLRDGQ